MSHAPIVLIIEDDQQLRETVQMIVESTGREAWVAQNGREALELLAQQDRKPSLIILDMMMPEMGGAEFLKKKLADPMISDIPVIVVTAARDIRLPEGSVKLRRKPFDLQDLVNDMDKIFSEQPTSLA